MSITADSSCDAFFPIDMESLLIEGGGSMNKSNNVIDLRSRLKNQDPNQSRGQGSGLVVDMTERRNEMLTHERRKVRRTILTEFISAHVVIPERGLQKVNLYDISEDGIAFDLDTSAGKFSPGDEVGFRLYLNHQIFFPFVITVANVRTVPEEGVNRHGGTFVKGSINDVALHHLVKFIETVSASLRTDNGDVMVSGLRW